jgi:hypothetical protein
LKYFEDYGLHFFSSKTVNKSTALCIGFLSEIGVEVISLIIFDRTHSVAPSRFFLSARLCLPFGSKVFLFTLALVQALFVLDNSAQRVNWLGMFVLIFDSLYLLNMEYFLSLLTASPLEWRIYRNGLLYFRLLLLIEELYWSHGLSCRK